MIEKIEKSDDLQDAFHTSVAISADFHVLKSVLLVLGRTKYVVEIDLSRLALGF